MPKFLENGLQVVDEALIADVVRRIVERFRPDRVVLFGSHARGDAGPESDMDLFIEMESELRPVERAYEIQRFFGARRWGLDVFVYTPAEVREARTRRGNLMSYVDAERAGRSMSDTRADTDAWLRKAQQDFEAAEVLRQAEDPLWDIVVFHAQQAAEKVLKAVVVFMGHQPPKSHDLVRLLSLCVDRFPDLARFTDDCAFLSPLAVLSRYPGDHAETAADVPDPRDQGIRRPGRGEGCGRRPLGERRQRRRSVRPVALCLGAAFAAVRQILDAIPTASDR